MRVRLLAFVAVLLVATLLALAWLASGAARGPRVDGGLRFAGLKQPVQVLRDGNGIPYIFAANLPDLIRAQGFVVAQSRLFQLEAYRALALGRLAEAIGERGLPNDREMRRIGLKRNADRHARRLAPSAREFLGWYAEGLNAYIGDHAEDHPLELKLAGFHTAPWTVEDLVAVLHFVNLSQAANYKSELIAQRLIDTLGVEKARELFPLNRNPDRARPVAETSGTSHAMVLDLAATNRTLFAQVGTSPAPASPIAMGSNNWAIAPARSASGAAVVVNDPHLDARLLPGIWMPVGLFCPEVRAVGAALPALPGILVGRNAQVAFGVTNAYGDSQDLFIEQLAPGRPDHYIDGDVARPFEVVREIIRVKDKAAPGGFREETLEVRRTARGPVISEAPLGPARDRVLVLRTAAAELPGGEIGIDRLLVAQDAAAVDRAVQDIDVMYFNFVFADKAGVIGHRASGRVPIRRSGQGIHPKPVLPEDDWNGFIAPERMPGQMAPARGWIATANHDNRPDAYPYDYSSFFSPPYRVERIGQVLDGARGMTTDRQRDLLADARNLQAARLLPAVLEALRGDAELADIAAILAAWDGVDRADAPAPLIYQSLYQRIAYETFVDELGEELARAWLRSWYDWQERFDALVRTPDASWFDDRRTPKVETLPDIIRRAGRAVRAELAARHGADPGAWRWGAEHRIHFDSPLRRTGFGRDWLGRAPMAMAGSGETVLRARTHFMEGFDVAFFASMRLVADLGDDAKVEAVVSGGVVDRQFHPYQKNQLEAWASGGLLPWWFERGRIEAHARSRQRLEPAGR